MVLVFDNLIRRNGPYGCSRSPGAPDLAAQTSSPGCARRFQGSNRWSTPPHRVNSCKNRCPRPSKTSLFLKISYEEMGHIGAPGAHGHPNRQPKHRPRGAREGCKGQIGGPTLPIGSSHAKIPQTLKNVTFPQNLIRRNGPYRCSRSPWAPD